MLNKKTHTTLLCNDTTFHGLFELLLNASACLSSIMGWNLLYYSFRIIRSASLCIEIILFIPSQVRFSNDSFSLCSNQFLWPDLCYACWDVPGPHKSTDNPLARRSEVVYKSRIFTLFWGGRKICKEISQLLWSGFRVSYACVTSALTLRVVYYTTTKHDKHLIMRTRRTFLECFQISGLLYHSVMHGLDFFICFMI